MQNETSYEEYRRHHETEAKRYASDAKRAGSPHFATMPDGGGHPILPRFADATAPAYSAIGQTCAQCGSPAWHVEVIHFCRSHDQGTMALSEGRCRICLTEPVFADGRGVCRWESCEDQADREANQATEAAWTENAAAAKRRE